MDVGRIELRCVLAGLRAVEAAVRRRVGQDNRQRHQNPKASHDYSLDRAV
jgi:hypothetical protein